MLWHFPVQQRTPHDLHVANVRAHILDRKRRADRFAHRLDAVFFQRKALAFWIRKKFLEPRQIAAQLIMPIAIFRTGIFPRCIAST